MKKLIARVLQTALALGAAGYGGTEAYEFAIENYGDTEIVLDDGTVYETKEITTHKDKVFPNREYIDIHTIVWHHAAWETQNVDDLANWHVNGNNWAGIGYHGAIKKDGTYLILNPLDKLTYHSKGSNKNSIGICFMADGREDGFTENQIKTAKIMLEAFCLELDVKRSVGHRDVRQTSCPSEKGYEQLQENGIFFNNK